MSDTDDLLDELLSYSIDILDDNYDPSMADTYLGEIAYIIKMLDETMREGNIPTRWATA